jgi:hypothetical protein
MTIARRALLLAIPLTLLALSSAPNAAPKGAWDGVWTGRWNGQYDTSVTIARNRVTEYTYRGYPVPFSGHGKVTADTVSFGKEFTVTLTKTSETTASAAYHGSNGDETAYLTRQ